MHNLLCFGSSIDCLAMSASAFRHKAVEIEKMREKQPIARLSMMLKMAAPSRDFIGALRAAQARKGKPGLIAEVKKASPSKGVIQPDFDAVKVQVVLSTVQSKRYVSSQVAFANTLVAAMQKSNMCRSASAAA